jgi:hypothetical protein
MKPLKVIGIDPSSGDYQCALITQGEKKLTHKTFLVTNVALNSFISWVQEEDVDIIAMEGQGGFCIPLENSLRREHIPFFSFNAFQIARYRQAVLGQHKNNRKDASAVAYYALTLYAHNELEHFKRTWFPDPILRPLTRMYEQKQKEATREINRLWKCIHAISGDLFLFLRNLVVESGRESPFTQFWLLRLLSIYPDIHEWQFISTQELVDASGAYSAESCHPFRRKPAA